MKLLSYFPWVNQANNFFYFDDDVIRDAVKREDISNLIRVFLEKPKFRDTIAYALARSANDNFIISFIRQSSCSGQNLSSLLSSLGIAKRLTLAKQVFYEFEGWVEQSEVINFVATFSKE